MTPRKLSMRISLVALAAFLTVFVAGTTTAQETTVKIVVVDLERVVALSESGKALQAKLEAFQTNVQAEGEQMNVALNALRTRIASGAQSLSEEKLAEMQKEFEDLTIDMRRFRDDKQREGQKIQAEGLKSIEVLLEPVFKQIRDENGYDLILNYAPGIVVMAGEKVDITQTVIDRINAASPGS